MVAFCIIKVNVYSTGCYEKCFKNVEQRNLLISISRLIAEGLKHQNLFTESNLANWSSSYVQFSSGGHFSERAEAAR